MVTIIGLSVMGVTAAVTAYYKLTAGRRLEKAMVRASEFEHKFAAWTQAK
jgi:hypothetical protein